MLNPLENLLRIQGVLSAIAFDGSGHILTREGDPRVFNQQELILIPYLLRLYAAFDNSSTHLNELNFEFENGSLVSSRYEHTHVVAIVSSTANVPFIQTSVNTAAQQLTPGSPKITLPLFSRKADHTTDQSNSESNRLC